VCVRGLRNEKEREREREGEREGVKRVGRGDLAKLREVKRSGLDEGNNATKRHKYPNNYSNYFHFRRVKE
jgi:hypothetical protein